VVDVEQAKIAEAAGAVAVMALERIPADIRRDGGVARMSDPSMIKEIKAAVTIPVMAKVSEEGEMEIERKIGQGGG
jgi:pyridoxal 5'-phosphate synthase pdxS subunit